MARAARQVLHSYVEVRVENRRLQLVRAVAVRQSAGLRRVAAYPTRGRVAAAARVGRSRQGGQLLPGLGLTTGGRLSFPEVPVMVVVLERRLAPGVGEARAALAKAVGGRRRTGLVDLGQSAVAAQRVRIARLLLLAGHGGRVALCGQLGYCAVAQLQASNLGLFVKEKHRTGFQNRRVRVRIPFQTLVQRG